MPIKQIDLVKFKNEYPIAFEQFEDFCVGWGDEEDARSPETFNYYIYDEEEGTVVAEPKQVGGPREPAYIWSGSIVYDVHEARWFCSEDADEHEELELGIRLNKLSPGGIGGW